MTDNSGQLKEAIEVLKKLHNWLDYGAGELEPTANKVIEAIDTVVKELEKPTYTPADMEAFHKWLNDNGWYLIERIWHNDSTDEELTLDEVIITWEESE